MLNKILNTFSKSPTEKAIAHENKFMAHNYHPLPVVLSRGEGVHVWDIEGNKYLDMMSAYSAVSFGHSHPRLVRKMMDQAQTLAVCSRAFHTDKLGPFMEKLCAMTGLDMALPMNTGAEAVETGIKAARRWGYQVKKIPDNQAEIIVAAKNFHGRTTTIVSFSSDENSRTDFGPFTPGFVMVPHGDLDAIKAAITPNTCAVLIEPIQGEAGIRIPPAGFMKDLRSLCYQEKILLIWDEVQSGLGRTGKNFCFEHEGARPDALILGKALGGGLLPVSALVGRRDVMSLFTPGSHGSTFGGNALSSAVAFEALCILEEEDLSGNSAILGDYFIKELEQLETPLIREVRGRGLWVGVDFDPGRVAARSVCEKLMARGILAKETQKTTIRFAPPLCVTRADIDFCLTEFRDVLKTF